MDSESDDYSVDELLEEAIDAADVCRVFFIAADATDPPSSYDAALEYIEVVIGHLEEAQDLLRARFTDQDAEPPSRWPPPARNPPAPARRRPCGRPSPLP